MPQGIDQARVWGCRQLQLFPAHPRETCEAIGLGSLAAVRLHERGWLSFDPAAVTELDASQEAELIFLGSLVAAGCDEGMLVLLLSELKRPYAYSLARIYYDWLGKSWRLMPDTESLIDARIEAMIENGEENDLQSLRDSIDAALEALDE